MPKAKKQKTKKAGACDPTNELEAAYLLGVADDYLTVACLATVYAKDATSRRGIERIGNALAFASRVIGTVGRNEQ